MHRALHLGVQKALGEVVLHYRVNLEAISTGYIIPVSVDDEVEMYRVSVRNVVPTLTSSKCQGLSLNGRC
jgi:hypothetical protein